MIHAGRRIVRSDRLSKALASSLVPQRPPTLVRQQWVEVTNGAESYWWCESTDQTTTVGAAQPLAWEEVHDAATGAAYWWCEESGATTAVGAACPKWDAAGDVELEVRQRAPPFILTPPQDQRGLAEQQQSSPMGSMVVLGGGVAVGSIAVSLLWRGLFG